MPKFFVTSDIHSFYTELIHSLNEVGFDKNNEDHWLIVCGDCFDRGPDSEKLLHFLMQLERKVLVKGNHDILLDELCGREFPYSYDKHNGTLRTVQDLGGSSLPSEFNKSCQTTWNKLARYRELLVNYFETQNYIFVHSWIPLNPKGFDTYTYREDWRDATDSEWEKAMWGNPFFHAQDKLNETGKTIVFGHWHCSTGHAIDSGYEIGEFESNAIWEPYLNESLKILGVDRCTAHTGECNVVVLEDEFPVDSEVC